LRPHQTKVCGNNTFRHNQSLYIINHTTVLVKHVNNTIAEQTKNYSIEATKMCKKLQALNKSIQ